MRDLRELRELAGLSQRELAARSGVDHSLVSRFENGDREPTLGQRGLLEAALGVVPAVVGGRRRLDPYPWAPVDPVARRAWVDARNARIRGMR